MGRMRTWALVAVAALAAYFALFGGEVTVPELHALDARAEALQERLTALRVEVDSLADLAHRLESDPATLERVARERYGMIREGEVLYRFVEPRALDTPEPSR